MAIASGARPPHSRRRLDRPGPRAKKSIRGREGVPRRPRGAAGRSRTRSLSRTTACLLPPDRTPAARSSHAWRARHCPLRSAVGPPQRRRRLRKPFRREAAAALAGGGPAAVGARARALRHAAACAGAATDLRRTRGGACAPHARGCSPPRSIVGVPDARGDAGRGCAVSALSQKRRHVTNRQCLPVLFPASHWLGARRGDDSRRRVCGVRVLYRESRRSYSTCCIMHIIKLYTRSKLHGGQGRAPLGLRTENAQRECFIIIPMRALILVGRDRMVVAGTRYSAYVQCAPTRPNGHNEAASSPTHRGDVLQQERRAANAQRKPARRRPRIYIPVAIGTRTQPHADLPLSHHEARFKRRVRRANGLCSEGAQAERRARGRSVAGE